MSRSIKLPLPRVVPVEEQAQKTKAMIRAFYGEPVGWPTPEQLPAESAEEAGERLREKFGRASQDDEEAEDTDGEESDSGDEGVERDPPPAAAGAAAAPAAGAAAAASDQGRAACKAAVHRIALRRPAAAQPPRSHSKIARRGTSFASS